MIGRVVSTKLKNTATVLVERIAKHPLYGKTFVQSKKYQVDDSLGVKLGDIVEIINIKPVSKNKHWKIVKVVGKSLQEITEEKLKEEAEKVVAEALPAGRQVMPEEEKGKRETGKGEEVTNTEVDEDIKSKKRKDRKEDKREKKGE